MSEEINSRVPEGYCSAFIEGTALLPQTYLGMTLGVTYWMMQNGVPFSELGNIMLGENDVEEIGKIMTNVHSQAGVPVSFYTYPISDTWSIPASRLKEIWETCKRHVVFLAVEHARVFRKYRGYPALSDILSPQVLKKLDRVYREDSGIQEDYTRLVQMSWDFLHCVEGKDLSLQHRRRIVRNDLGGYEEMKMALRAYLMGSELFTKEQINVLFDRQYD